MFVLFLVQFGLLGGHLLEDGCSFGLPCVFFVFWLFVILAISRFGLEGWIWVMVASVPGLWTPFAF